MSAPDPQLNNPFKDRESHDTGNSGNYKYWDKESDQSFRGKSRGCGRRGEYNHSNRKKWNKFTKFKDNSDYRSTKNNEYNPSAAVDNCDWGNYTPSEINQMNELNNRGNRTRRGGDRRRGVRNKDFDNTDKHLKMISRTFETTKSSVYNAHTENNDANTSNMSHERIENKENPVNPSIPSEFPKGNEIKIANTADGGEKIKADSKKVYGNKDVDNIKPTVTSSSSDSDSSETNDSDVKDLKKVVNKSFLQKTEVDAKTNKNKSESFVKDLQKVFKDKSLKTEPNTETATTKTLVPKKKESASSSSDSSSDSDTDDSIPIKNIKKEKNSEDDVVFLGKMENVETLVDDDSLGPNEEICLLCDKKGHISFYCLMICKNCGDKYHGLKNCPKPANLSTVLQSFTEFCLSQVYQYNPDQRYIFNQVKQDEVTQNNSQMFNVDSLRNIKRKHTASSVTRSSPTPSRISRKRNINSETESTSDESYSRRKRIKHKYLKSKNATNNSFPQMFNSPFTSVLPVAFNPQAMPFNPQGVQVNPMLTYAQMMGFNPLNFSNKSS